MEKTGAGNSFQKLNILLTLGFVISLIPILILAFYNFPSADDFSASDTVCLAWKNSGSIVEVIKAAGENVVYNYKNWSGVYASVFWTSLQPGIFGEQFYGVTTVITIALLVAAGYYLGNVILKKYLQIRGNEGSCIIILYLFTTIHLMPNGNEGLYWHAGVVNYTWAFGFLLLLAGILLSLRKEENPSKKTGKTILACILAILVGGGNYITALQGTMWLILLAVTSCAADKSVRKNRSVILAALIMAASFAVSVLAPGNAVRMGMSSGLEPIRAVLQSFVFGLQYPLKEWLSWPVILLFICALPLMWSVAKKTDFRFPYPAAVVLLAYCMVSAGFTPSLYAQGSVAAGRLQNTVYFLFVLTLYGAGFYVVGWGSKRYEFNREKSFAWGFLIIFAAASLLYLYVNQNLYIGTEATVNLLSGKAKIYRQENRERLQLLKDPNVQNVVVRPYSDPPGLLLFQDISFDSNEWINSAVAEYYGKESVRVGY